MKSIYLKIFLIYTELFRKIQEKNVIKALSFFTSKDIKTLSKTRNPAFCEYEKINLSLLKVAIEDYLPKLQKNLKRGMDFF